MQLNGQTLNGARNTRSVHLISVLSFLGQALGQWGWACPDHHGSGSTACYLCLWDSRNTALHYKKRNWPLRTSYEIGTYNVKQQPLVDAAKILMAPLHIKLGLIKQFVKQLNTEGEAFKYIQELFPKLSEAKSKLECLWDLK